MPTLTIHACAKLNLFLDVLGRRADGFHRLETIFQTIALDDGLVVAHTPGGAGLALTCDDPGIPADAGNLVWRAAAAFIAGRAAQAGGLRLHLRKGIPHGAGLGGGSSDAAATLRALSQLFPGWHDAAGLQRLAAALGSDVPFFLVGGTALGEERGEVLTALPDLPPMPITVLMPAAQLPTPQVFRALSDDERGPRPGRGAAWWRQRLAAPDWPALLANRLTAPATRLCPAVGTLLEHLRTLGIPHLMSGSGAACFALGHVAAPPGVTAWHTTTITRDEALQPGVISA